MSYHARSIRRRDNKYVSVSDKQDEMDTPARPPSKRREIFPRLVLPNEQLTA